MILSEAELVRWGRRIGAEVDCPVFITLSGPLGAGKSVLARAVARGAGVEGPLPSPTFNLIFRYEGSREVPGLPEVPVEIIHMDLYRLREPDELWELGWEDLGGAQEIILVEWPARAGDLLPDDRWEIRLVPTAPGAEYREVFCSRVGNPPHLPGFPVTLFDRGPDIPGPPEPTEEDD